MKILNLFYKPILIIGVLTFFITGCEKDDPVKVTEEFIIGSWEVANIEADGTIDGKSMLEYYMDESGLSEAQAEFLINYTIASFSGMYDGVYEFKSDYTYIHTFNDASDGEESGTWVLGSDGEIIILNEGTEYEMNFTVKSKGSNTLDVEYKLTDSYDVNEDGDDEELSLVIDLSLTKK